MKFKCILLLLITIFSCNVCFSQKKIEIQVDSIYFIGTETLYLEDPTNALSFDEIISKDNEYNFIKSNSRGFNFGASTSSYWFKFKIENKLKGPIGLKVGRNFSDKIWLYSILENDSVKIRKYGIGMRQNTRDFDVHDYIFKLETAKYYVIELKNLSGPVIFKPSVSSIHNQLTQTYRVAINWGIYFGMIIILGIYSIIIFIYSKNVAPLFYLGFIVFSSLQISMLMGTTALFYPESLYMAISKNHIFPYPFVVFFAFLFLEKLLHFREKGRILYYFGAIWTITAIIGVSLHFFGYEYFAFTVTFMLAIPFLTIFLIGLVFLSYKYGSTTRIITTGNIIFGLGAGLFMISELGFMEGNKLTENGFILGSSLEMIIFAIAMATESNINRKEKEKSQQLAILQSKQFSLSLIETLENERKRIAAELHDGIGQSLIIIKNKILLFKQNRLNESLDTLAENVSATIEDARTISYGLRPHKLDAFGLTASIEDLLSETQSATEIKINSEVDVIDKIIPPQLEINIYRIIQELLNNLIKHANCSEANIKLKRIDEDQKLQILISDNGDGLQDPDLNAKSKSGFGLKGIAERIESLQGTLEINSKKDEGVSIKISIPFHLSDLVNA